jgi:predicted RNase H-like HicB family nuclease
MLLEYIRVAMRQAVYKILEDGSYFGEIQGFKGVWADASNLEDCRENLQSTLEDWLLLSVRLDHAMPILDGIDINIKTEIPTADRSG